MKSKQQREKEKIRVNEMLEAMGQKSEKEGIKWTKKFMDEFDKKEWEKDQIRREKLQKNRKTKKQYYKMIAGMMHEMLQEIDKPSGGWKCLAYPNSKGVVVQVKNIFGRMFQRAFTPCGIPKIDLHAVNVFLGSAEDAMYKVENDGELDIKTKSGIYLK